MIRLDWLVGVVLAALALAPLNASAQAGAEAGADIANATDGEAAPAAEDEGSTDDAGSDPLSVDAGSGPLSDDVTQAPSSTSTAPSSTSTAPGGPNELRLSPAEPGAPSANEPAPHLATGPFDMVTGARELWLESLGFVGLISYMGWVGWHWGNASFSFGSEGWFGPSTGSGGMDKLGHAFGGYVVTDILSRRLQYLRGPEARTNLYPAVFTSALLLYVEMFDGFSADHGWSNEDLVMNTSGVVLSYLRNVFPAFGAAFDFRYQYIPSKGTGVHPYIDYSGQKYFAIVKLEGFEPFRGTPAELLEFHLGYYTRGFRKSDIADERRQELVVGVGLNVSKLLFEPLKPQLGVVHTLIDGTLDYIQVPYSYHSLPVYHRTYPRR